MKLQLFTILFCLSLSSPPLSARFFPNTSSIPPPLLSDPNPAAWDAFFNLSGCRYGEKVTGLSKLKQYFNYFGYIPNANFTEEDDDFDDALKNAVKTYQQNFNLNVTGELDEYTLQEITKPRCGNADIVNGTTTMNSGKKTTSHFHNIAHYSFFPGTPRWPEGRRSLTYAFAPQNQLPDSAKLVFTRAFNRWAAVIPMNFTEAPDFAEADITIGFFTGDHGDGEPFDGVLGTLAHAFSPPSGRFHLDGAENWVIDGESRGSGSSSAIDLETVAVHEIGHLLGLGHSSVRDAIMYPTITSGTKKVELQSDDVEGIQSLYGSNPNYKGSSSSTSPGMRERETLGNDAPRHSGSRWGIGALVALGFAGLIL